MKKGSLDYFLLVERRRFCYHEFLGIFSCSFCGRLFGSCLIRGT